MQYRAVLPAQQPAGQKLRVMYLLHGGGGGFRDWTNYSDVARYAERGFLLIMPEGESSYYMNSATRSQDRFEDYIIHDLITDVEQRFPALAGRQNRAIIGISMGGFGAVVLGLKHPELFAFVGGLSSALDVPSRPFSIKRMEQWRHHSSIFGSRGSEKRKANDPYVLARQAHRAAMPYIFLSCGEQEGLLAANRKFASILKEMEFAHEFHSGPGGHDWNQWNSRLPELFASLEQHLEVAK
jgi:putative tributyrin esterase